MVGLTPWFAPVEWAGVPTGSVGPLPCPLSCGHLPAERMPPGMAAWQARGSLHKRAPTPTLVFRPCKLSSIRGAVPLEARLVAALAAERVNEEAGHDFTITACVDGAHAAPGSLHYAGAGIDIRTCAVPVADLPKPSARVRECLSGVRRDLRSRSYPHRVPAQADVACFVISTSKHGRISGQMRNPQSQSAKATKS